MPGAVHYLGIWAQIGQSEEKIIIPFLDSYSCVESEEDRPAFGSNLLTGFQVRTSDEVDWSLKKQAAFLALHGVRSERVIVRDLQNLHGRKRFLPHVP